MKLSSLILRSKYEVNMNIISAVCGKGGGIMCIRTVNNIHSLHFTLCSLLRHIHCVP